MDALDRCEAMGGGDLHIRLLKVVTVVDMFKDRSGLGASRELLSLALPGHDKEIEAALDDLQRWSFVIYRKFTDAYSIFEGSDFNIDHAVEQALESIGKVYFASLNALAGLQPIVAKRHYHETGALRWFDISVVPVSEVEHRRRRVYAAPWCHRELFPRNSDPRRIGRDGRGDMPSCRTEE